MESALHRGGGGGTPRTIGRLRAARFPKPFTLFKTKMSDYSYPIYDLTKSFDTLVRPGARFSEATEFFRARKAIFSSSVLRNGEVYTPATT